MLNSVPVLNQVTPEDIAEELKKDLNPWTSMSIHYSQREIKKHWPSLRSSLRLYEKYLLQFDRLPFKQGVLHQLYINSDVEYHQMILH